MHASDKVPTPSGMINIFDIAEIIHGVHINILKKKKKNVKITFVSICQNLITYLQIWAGC